MGKTATDIQVDNFFGREDLEFISCPLCERPLLKRSCLDRQIRYPPSKVNGNYYHHEKQGLCASSECGHYIADKNPRDSHPWHESDWPVNRPRLSDQQLEQIHEKRRVVYAASPMVGAERFND